MNKENITITKITADKGKILTNGTVYGREIYLGASQSADSYFEISEAEYETIISSTEE